MNGEKPVLATDWDDVYYGFLANYLSVYNRQHGTDFRPQDVLDHDLARLFGKDPEYVEATVDDYHINHESVKDGLMDSVQIVLPILARKFDIDIITSRKSQFRYRIENMVAEYIPGTIRDIYLRDSIEKYGGKGPLAKSLGAVALVDDHITNILSAESSGVRGLLRNMPKNYHRPLTFERVNDWYDVYEKLTGEHFNPALRQ